MNLHISRPGQLLRWWKWIIILRRVLVVAHFSLPCCCQRLGPKNRGGGEKMHRGARSPMEIQYIYIFAKKKLFPTLSCFCAPLEETEEKLGCGTTTLQVLVPHLNSRIRWKVFCCHLTFIANSCTRSPAHTGWVCASTSPGTMLFPRTSSTRKKEDFAYRFSISASPPKSIMLPCLQMKMRGR